MYEQYVHWKLQNIAEWRPKYIKKYSMFMNWNFKYCQLFPNWSINLI